MLLRCGRLRNRSRYPRVPSDTQGYPPITEQHPRSSRPRTTAPAQPVPGFLWATLALQYLLALCGMGDERPPVLRRLQARENDGKTTPTPILFLLFFGDHA